MFTNENARTYQSGHLFLGVAESGRQVGLSTDRHAICIAGSRSGKGAGLIIPNLKRWPHNILCIDPKGENAELTYQDREAMGQAVYVLDPFESAAVPDRIRARFNPLASVDLTSNRARKDIADIANGLVVVTDPKHMEWINGARDILAGIIAYIIADAPPEYRNFAQVRALLMQPTSVPAEGEEPQGLWADAHIMAQDNRVGGLIRNAGVTLITAMESEKGMEKEFLGLARRSTQWLDDDAIADCLSDSSFQMSDLKTSNAAVFLVLPSDGSFLETYGAFLRLFVKTALNAMGKQQQGKRCLFILDEVYSLGKLEELVDSAGRLPSYGVHLFLFFQNLTQSHERYGKEGTETFFGNADAHIFFGNTDGTTLDYISKRIGNYTPQEIAKSPPRRDGFGSNFQGEEENRMRLYQHRMGLAGTPRLPADQIKDLVAKHDGEDVAKSMIVFGKGSDIFNLGLGAYFKPVQAYEAAVPAFKKQEQEEETVTAIIIIVMFGGALLISLFDLIFG